jgi:hypothetical protein
MREITQCRNCMAQKGLEQQNWLFHPFWGWFSQRFQRLTKGLNFSAKHYMSMCVCISLGKDLFPLLHWEFQEGSALQSTSHTVHINKYLLNKWVNSSRSNPQNGCKPLLYGPVITRRSHSLPHSFSIENLSKTQAILPWFYLLISPETQPQAALRFHSWDLASEPSIFCIFWHAEIYSQSHWWLCGKHCHIPSSQMVRIIAFSHFVSWRQGVRCSSQKCTLLILEKIFMHGWQFRKKRNTCMVCDSSQNSPPR